MIIDSSALVAILREEPEAESFREIIADAQRPELSAATYLETSIVIDRSRDTIASEQVDLLIDALAMDIAPVTETQAKLARAAYREFGKHSGHPASLNFGDCFAYALAKERGEPLLFKGDDFARTDLFGAG